MPRTRLIRPEFFGDELMADLSIETRFVYIGMWTLTDDAGFFDWKPRQIAAEIFPYDTAGRDAMIATAIVDLLAARRIRHESCNDHGVIPTIPDHRVKGGVQLFTIRKRHEQRCFAVKPAGLRSTTDTSVSESVSESDSESGGSLRSQMLRHGGKAADLVLVHDARRGVR